MNSNITLLTKKRNPLGEKENFDKINIDLRDTSEESLDDSSENCK